MRHLHYASLIFGAFAATPSFGYIVEADPANYAAGTELTEAFEGSSLNLARSGLDPNFMGAIYATDCLGDACDAPTNGKRVFSPTSAPINSTPVFSYQEEFRKKITTGTSNYGSDILLAQFDNASSFVEVTGQSSSFNSWYLDVWSKAGELLASCSNTGPFEGSDGCIHTRSGYGPEENAWMGDAWTVSFASEASDIGFISVGGWFGPAYVHKLSYAVPEPAPLALFVAGMAGFVLLRKSKRKLVLPSI